MTPPVRWGIMGLGNISQAFAKGLRAVPDAQLVACGSRTAEKAAAFADQWKVPRRHSSYEALAADPGVDAIYIATPHFMHYVNSRLCLEHGKAVLCEKPFMVNAKQAAEVIALARRENRLIMEAMWTRFLPHMVQAHEMIAAGVIGEARMLQADFGFRCDWDPKSRLLNPELAGGGLLDVGVYTVSLAHMLFGVPIDIKGVAHIGATGVDEQAGIVLGFASGRIAVLSCGVRTGTPQEAIIMGTEGRIRIHASWWCPSKFTLSIKGKEDQLIAPPVAGNGYNYEAIEFNRCLKMGLRESPVAPLDDSLAVLKTLDALRSQWGLKYPFEG